MRIVRTAMFAALLAGATTASAAAETRLDAEQLDRVSAGFSIPASPLLQQLPAIFQAYGITEGLQAANVGGVVGQIGGGIGSLGGIFGRLPLGMPMMR